MAANFWDLSHAVLRDNEAQEDHFHYSGHQGGSFAAEGHWLWHSPEANESRPSLLFDLYDNSGTYGKLSYSEPVSPSSVDTTPTSSELPEVVRSNTIACDDDYEDPLVAQISVAKRARKAPASPAADRNGRKKKYDAPPGVWRNSGGFISTVYINKKRVYGPLRRDVNDAVRDREEMLLAKSVILTEEGMRAFVQGMKERFGANRQAITALDIQAQPPAAGIERSQSAVSQASSVSRNSSRPVRAAAKRNLFAAYSSSIDEEEPEMMQAELSSQEDFGALF